MLSVLPEPVSCLEFVDIRLNMKHTFDHSSMSISPAVVSTITRPWVGKDMTDKVSRTVVVRMRAGSVFTNHGMSLPER